MNPKSPLPWDELPCYFDNQCQAFEPKDADFILHACNAYPRLVAALKQAVLDGYGQYLPFNSPHVALLKELGEHVDQANV